MQTTYQALLDATIGYLERLKAQGTKYVIVNPATLAALRDPTPTPAATSSPLAMAAGIPTAAASSQPAPGAKSSVLGSESVRGGAPSASAHAAAPAGVTAPLAAEALELGFVAPTAGLSGEARAQAMAELRARALACVRCPHLAATRQQVVFGVGDIHAPLMFVGEAPGADEDAQGEPFVGKAGQLLTRIIQTMGFTRETVYIANILKCRPDTPGQTTGNRKPTPEEMKTCLPYLLQQIDLIQPQVLVALGATAMEGLLGRPVSITKTRGHWHTFRHIPVMPTYHPAYLLRNPSPRAKREVWEDMLQVLEKLGRPITDKQRGYFLPR